MWLEGGLSQRGNFDLALNPISQMIGFLMLRILFQTDEDYAYLVEALLIAKIGFRSTPKTNPNIKNENRGRRGVSARRLNKMGKCDRAMIMSSATKDAAIVFGKFESQSSGTGMMNY